jgi:hypothetical protein
LNNLAAAGSDAFTLARIAGDSSIQIIMCSCHPQADAIERAFVQMANRQEVATDDGQCEKPSAEGEALCQALGLTAARA